MPQVIVDANTCTGCGICARVCPVTVFDIADRQAVATRVATCMACELCVVECPWRSISVDRLATPAAIPTRPATASVGGSVRPAPSSPAPMLPITHGVEALPGVQPVLPASQPAAASVVPTPPPPTAPMPGAYAPVVVVPPAGPAVLPAAANRPSLDRAIVVKSEQKAPQDTSLASSFLPVPDSFPYIIVKKASPESGVE